MIVANAVAVLPTSTDRLDGNTGLVLVAPTGVVIRPIVAPATVNHSAPSGPAAGDPRLGEPQCFIRSATIPKAPVDALGIGYSVTTRKW
jgi:hypothetical protein